MLNIIGSIIITLVVLLIIAAFLNMVIKTGLFIGRSAKRAIFRKR